MSEHYKFFQNTACEYFPCHENVVAEQFNCLFCFCPLYPLGDACGGSFAYNAAGIKDCSACRIPHLPESYDEICRRFPEVAAVKK